LEEAMTEYDIYHILKHISNGMSLHMACRIDTEYYNLVEELQRQGYIENLNWGPQIMSGDMDFYSFRARLTRKGEEELALLTLAEL
jgi:hypothetical protein